MVEDVEPDPEHHEESELQENDEAADPQGARGIPLAARAEVSLHDDLIHTVGAEGQKRAADDSGPEHVRVGEGEAEVEDPELVVFDGRGPELGPAPGQLSPGGACNSVHSTVMLSSTSKVTSREPSGTRRAWTLPTGAPQTYKVVPGENRDKSI